MHRHSCLRLLGGLELGLELELVVIQPLSRAKTAVLRGPTSARETHKDYLIFLKKIGFHYLIILVRDTLCVQYVQNAK